MNLLQNPTLSCIVVHCSAWCSSVAGCFPLFFRRVVTYSPPTATKAAAKGFLLGQWPMARTVGQEYSLNFTVYGRLHNSILQIDNYVWLCNGGFIFSSPVCKKLIFGCLYLLKGNLSFAVFTRAKEISIDFFKGLLWFLFIFYSINISQYKLGFKEYFQ